MMDSNTSTPLFNIPWEPFFLPNIPLYQTKLTKDIVDRLWGYVNKAEVNFSSRLAGNIHKSLSLEDEDDFFMKDVLEPVTGLYTVNYQSCTNWIQYNYQKKDELSLVLDEFWVNYQNKHEFNPVHDHSGLVSFVVWMKVPTHFKEQYEIPFCKASNCPSASNFEFCYTDMLGNVQNYVIPMSPEQEGWIILFPSRLRHQVYPFYNCDEQRISISGNISYKLADD